MKRFWLVSLVVVLSAALAIPAFAEHEIGGFYRAKGWLSNYQAFNFGNIVARGLTSTDSKTNAYVEQRARFKYTFTNNEWAKTVFYIEADNVWGDSQFDRAGNRNTGGGLGADNVAIEIKNLYTWFQIPDTEFKFQVGLQNFNDAYYGNFLGVNDTGGIIGWYKTGSIGWRYGWLKFSEQFTSSSATNGTHRSDDADLYLVEAKFKPAENFDLGVNLYFYDDNRNRAGNQGTPLIGTPTIPGGSTADIYIIGSNFVYKLDAVTLTGFLAYETGEVSSQTTAADRDISAFGINLRGDFKIGDGTAFVEGIYLSGDDNSADNDIEGWQVSPGINAPFYYRPDMKIMFYNGDNLTTATAFFGDGNQSGNADGRGVIAIMFGYKQKIAENWEAKVGAGYGMDAEGDSAPSAAGTLDSDEKSIIEVNAYLNYLVTKGLTVGVYGAYGFLSDTPAANDATRTQEADDLYQAIWRLNYSF